VTKFDVSILLTSQVMDCQMHEIGKAVRPLFADLVTNADVNSKLNIIQVKVRAARLKAIQ